MKEFHDIADLVYMAITAGGLIIGLMIRNAISTVGTKIDVHIGKDEVTHRDIERRIDRLENVI